MTALQERTGPNSAAQEQPRYDWHVTEGASAQGTISNAGPDFQKLRLEPNLCVLSQLLSPAAVSTRKGGRGLPHLYREQP